VNKAQRIALRLFGSAGEELEAEARAWILICPECGEETSLFALGETPPPGVQPGAQVRRRCKRCQSTGRHELVHRPEA